MFHGSLPDSVQQIMGDCIRDWKCTDIYVGCSGNFTIERMLKSVTNARLHGNDVTIYSCLLGRYFSGAPSMPGLTRTTKARWTSFRSI